VMNYKTPPSLGEKLANFDALTRTL